MPSQFARKLATCLLPQTLTVPSNPAGTYDPSSAVVYADSVDLTNFLFPFGLNQRLLAYFQFGLSNEQRAADGTLLADGAGITGMTPGVSGSCHAYLSAISEPDGAPLTGISHLGTTATVELDSFGFGCNPPGAPFGYSQDFAAFEVSGSSGLTRFEVWGESSTPWTIPKLYVCPYFNVEPMITLIDPLNPGDPITIGAGNTWLCDLTDITPSIESFRGNNCKVQLSVSGKIGWVLLDNSGATTVSMAFEFYDSLGTLVATNGPFLFDATLPHSDFDYAYPTDLPQTVQTARVGIGTDAGSITINNLVFSWGFNATTRRIAICAQSTATRQVHILG